MYTSVLLLLISANPCTSPQQEPLEHSGPLAEANGRFGMSTNLLLWAILAGWKSTAVSGGGQNINFLQLISSWLVVTGSAASDGTNLGSQRPEDLRSGWLWRADGRRAEASRVTPAAVWSTHSAPTHWRVHHLSSTSAQQTAGCHHGAFYPNHQGTASLVLWYSRLFWWCNG